jgi:hypothetical protein
MNDELEPVVHMARTIYNETHSAPTDVDWDDLTDWHQREWLVATAHGHDAYWAQRHYLEEKGPRRANS